jgi:transposase
VGELQEVNRVLAEQFSELAARLGQTPRNSHMPPGSEGYEKPAPRSRRERTDRESGGQPGHEGRTLRQVSDPDEVLVHEPAACSGCGGSLADAPVVSTEARQVFDLPVIKLRVVEHRVEHRRCSCGQVTMADVPAGVGAPTQYGPGLRGLATYLLAGQYLPLARTAELLTELVGAPISQGSLARWYAEAAGSLDRFDEVLRAGLTGSGVLGADETGIRVAGALAWVHAARTDDLTRYTVSTKRGVEAMTEAGVLPALSPDTVLVTDFWGPYWSFDVIHAVCGAHLGRELVAAAEVPGQNGWAEAIDRLLTEINRTTGRARDDNAPSLAPTLLATYQRRYHELIEAGWAANPDYQPGQRGKRRRPKHVNLLDRLDTHREEVQRYAEDLRVPFTNNGSEQDVRPLKIRMKVAGCLRTMAGAQAFCQLRSYLSTARKQGQPAFAAMRMLHDGTPWMPTVAGQTS